MYKSDLTKNILGIIKELKLSDMPLKIVKYLSFNNTGENVIIVMIHKHEGIGIKFKYVAPDTSQQNRQGGLKFASMCGKVNVMWCTMQQTKDWRIK